MLWKKFFSFVFNLLTLALVISMAFIFRTYAFSTFQVSGPSMCATLNVFDKECQYGAGEVILVNKAVYQKFGDFEMGSPKRGDIIVFHSPATDEFLVKRVIGLPGETVRLQDGYIYIHNDEAPNGFQLEETYIGNQLGKTYPSDEAHTTFTVPHNSYFVMGDNRGVSSDSRVCFQRSRDKTCETKGATAFVDRSKIEGKAWVVIWPPNKARVLEDGEK